MERVAASKPEALGPVLSEVEGMAGKNHPQASLEAATHV
jgi:hypothetical protein